MSKIRSTKPLYELLVALFRSNDTIFELLLNYPYERAQALVDELPSTAVPRSTYVMQAIQQMQAHGVDQPRFFEVLAERFPGRTDLIEAGRQAYFEENASGFGEVERPAPAAAFVAAATPGNAALEKIMGDRPTFLDVAYLAVGYERSKAVAKLRMRFGDAIYSGTAFLVSADTLLTARHNLWADGQRADEVEVIFDYERSIDGPERQACGGQADIDSFVTGDPDDWALFKLSKPETGRPVLPLSTQAARHNDRVAIIQHPGGMLKQVALHHNVVTFVDESRVQYLTDTLPGSSGAPVLDAQWRVVAIHHMGGMLEVPGTKQTLFRNQGVPIHRVSARLAALGICP